MWRWWRKLNYKYSSESSGGDQTVRRHERDPVIPANEELFLPYLVSSTCPRSGGVIKRYFWTLTLVKWSFSLLWFWGLESLPPSTVDFSIILLNSKYLYWSVESSQSLSHFNTLSHTQPLQLLLLQFSGYTEHPTQALEPVPLLASV